MKNFITDEKIFNSSNNNIIFISYMFIFICLQYIQIIFVFNYNSVHRKHFSTNSILIIILLLILIIILQLLFFSESVDKSWIKTFVNFEDSIENFAFYSELNKIVTQGFAIVNLILSLSAEIFVVNKL